MKTKVRKANIHQSLFWILFVSFLTPSVGLIVKDDCSNVHGKQNQIASITASSENLVVDDTQKDNFDGDSFRFKRPDAKTGFVSYTSEKGFENIEIEGYVFGGLPKASWSLKVLRVDFDESGSSKENEILRLTEENLDDFLVPNSNDDWKKFYLRLLVRKNCPSNLIIVLEGAASNNEYPGWGLQVGNVLLVPTWFPKCKAECRFQRTVCSKGSAVQQVDLANDFGFVVVKSSNMRVDSSNPVEFYDGDAGRFTRTNNKTGEIVYVSTGGFRSIDVEVYQYPPFDAKLEILPFASEDCKPIVLKPNYDAAGSDKKRGDWNYRIARFDMSDLPLCPTQISVVLSGGEQGWELQISKVTVTFLGNLRYPVYLESTKSSEASEDEVVGQWWLWVCVLIGVIGVFVFAGFVIQRMALCFGDDERSIYHISNLTRYFKKQRIESPQHPVSQEVQSYPSFSFEVRAK